jgi:pyruvate kinase
MIGKTKIICTIGPSSCEVDVLINLINKGMNAARINFSHGDHVFHAKVIANVREASKRLNRNIPIIQDLCGPKIRIGKLLQDSIRLEEGQDCFLTYGLDQKKIEYIPLTNQIVISELKENSKILIDDGKITLQVIETLDNMLKCKALTSGEIKSGKGVNLPDTKLSLASLTSKDIDDLYFGIEQNVDIIALSFVRKAADVEPIRTIMESKGFRKPVIAKIEKPEAIRNIDDIIQAFDMIMVARGDLGVELPLEKVPMIQKDIIKKCNQSGKPVITATQMLESMILNPTPTRAEVTDIANAILDGTDAIMLSGETAMGKYPEKAVEMMAKTAKEVESKIDHDYILQNTRKLSGPTIEDAISLATYHTALTLNAKAIVTSTKSGCTARLVSRYRPQAQILAVTPKISTMRELELSWGVFPILIDDMRDTDDMFEKARNKAIESGFLENGDIIIITAGLPINVEGTTNLLKIERLDFGKNQ